MVRRVYLTLADWDREEKVEVVAEPEQLVQGVPRALPPPAPRRSRLTSAAPRRLAVTPRGEDGRHERSASSATRAARSPPRGWCGRVSFRLPCRTRVDRSGAPRCRGPRGCGQLPAPRGSSRRHPVGRCPRPPGRTLLRRSPGVGRVQREVAARHAGLRAHDHVRHRLRRCLGPAACWVGSHDLVQSGGGRVATTDRWGRRRFAYEINKKHEAYYVVLEIADRGHQPRRARAGPAHRGRGRPPQDAAPARQGSRPTRALRAAGVG